jgi:multidrug resistance efflux pump
MSDDNSYNFEVSIKERAVEKGREDARNFYNEVAGRETGRSSRFLSKEERERRRGKSTNRKAQLSAFDILMMDQAYAATYNRVIGLLTNTEQVTQAAIDEAEEKLL